VRCLILQSVDAYGIIGQDIYPPDQQTPQALATLQKVEIEKWWPIIKAAGIKAEGPRIIP